MIFNRDIAFIVIVFFSLTFVHIAYAQDDSLLKKISEMEISLDDVEDSTEDLYLPSVSFQTFYDELDPLGDWIKISKDEIKKDLKDGEGQGLASDIIQDEEFVYIWLPEGMPEGWHPYMNGRWVYTTNGWLWVSNYSWGWAAYHYGRWWNSPVYGWVWLPGYVWAPAWVRWRIAEGYIGWCPLTPYANWNIKYGITLENYQYRDRGVDWVFTNKEKFTDEITQSSRLNVKNNSDYISKSQNVLNISYENSRMQNLGPDFKDIEMRTGNKIAAREIMLSKDMSTSLVGDKTVTIYKHSFKKLAVNPKNGKPLNIDKPKKYKVSSKIRKNIKPRINKHKPHHFRHL